MALRRRIFSIVATPVLAAAPAAAQEPRTGRFQQHFGSVSVALGEGALIAILDTRGAVLRRSSGASPSGRRTQWISSRLGSRLASAFNFA